MMSESWESPDPGPEQVPEGSEDLSPPDDGPVAEEPVAEETPPADRPGDVR